MATFENAREDVRSTFQKSTVRGFADDYLYEIIYLTGMMVIVLGFAQFLQYWQSIFENGSWHLLTVRDVLEIFRLNFYRSNPDNASELIYALTGLPFSFAAMATGMAACIDGAVHIDRVAESA